MTQVAKKIMVTCALPYANGSIHLGHMLEHIQADIWVRYQRMRGNQVYFICADDAHGTPIMLKAQQLGISPEQMIAEMSQEHQVDFAGFNISYDNYHSTHSDENRVLSELIYTRLKENGFIKNRTISQLYDPEKGMFLPDRFVKGTCPKCKSPDQYGDNCEVCGATYSPTELIEPKSAAWRHAGNARLRALLLRSAVLQRHAAGLDALRRAAGAGGEQDAGVVRVWAAAVGYLPRRALLRLRNPRRTGQIFLRLAGCADRLYGRV